MRRHILVLSVFLAAGLAALTGIAHATETSATAAADQKALAKLSDDFAAAWNKNDYRTMAGFFAQDADLVNPVGRVARGRAEVERLFMDEQTGMFKGSHFTSTCAPAGIRMVKPDVAVVDCAFEVTGMTPAPGQPPMTSLKGSYTAVAVKQGGQWRWVAGRAMVPAPGAPPPSPVSR